MNRIVPETGDAAWAAGLEIQVRELTSVAPFGRETGDTGWT